MTPQTPQTSQPRTIDWAVTEQVGVNAVNETFTGINSTLEAFVAAAIALDVKINAFQESPGILDKADQGALTDIQVCSAALVVQGRSIQKYVVGAVPVPAPAPVPVVPS